MLECQRKKIYWVSTYHSCNEQCLEGISLCIWVIMGIPLNWMQLIKRNYIKPRKSFFLENQQLVNYLETYKAWVQSPPLLVFFQSSLASAKSEVSVRNRLIVLCTGTHSKKRKKIYIHTVSNKTTFLYVPQYSQVISRHLTSRDRLDNVVMNLIVPTKSKP